MTWRNPRRESIEDPVLRDVFDNLESFLARPSFTSAAFDSGQRSLTGGVQLAAPVTLLEPVDSGVGTKMVSGSLQSSNYVAGSAGWRISQDGDVEFSNGTFRGTLNVGNGPRILVRSIAGVGSVSFPSGNVDEVAAAGLSSAGNGTVTLSASKLSNIFGGATTSSVTVSPSEMAATFPTKVRLFQTDLGLASNGTAAELVLENGFLGAGTFVQVGSSLRETNQLLLSGGTTEWNIWDGPFGSAKRGRVYMERAQSLFQHYTNGSVLASSMTLTDSEATMSFGNGTASSISCQSGTVYITNGSFSLNDNRLNFRWPGNSSWVQMSTSLGGPVMQGETRVRLQTSTNGRTFDFDNDGYGRSAVGWTTYSSKRYKADISSWGVELVDRLRPVSFRRVDGGRSVGFVAEELVDVFSEAVAFDDLGRPDAVDYAKFVVPLVVEVQALKRRVAVLEHALSGP